MSIKCLIKVITRSDENIQQILEITKRKPRCYVSPVRGLVVELAAVRHAAGHAEALAQGPGGHVDEAEPGETGSSII